MFGGSRQHPAFVSVPGSCDVYQVSVGVHFSWPGAGESTFGSQSLIDQVLIVIAMSTKSLTRKILGQ